MIAVYAGSITCGSGAEINSRRFHSPPEFTTVGETKRNGLGPAGRGPLKGVLRGPGPPKCLWCPRIRVTDVRKTPQIWTNETIRQMRPTQRMVSDKVSGGKNAAPFFQASSRKRFRTRSVAEPSTEPRLMIACGVAANDGVEDRLWPWARADLLLFDHRRICPHQPVPGVGHQPA